VADLHEFQDLGISLHRGSYNLVGGLSFQHRGSDNSPMQGLE
jgi:hypothetical protein